MNTDLMEWTRKHWDSTVIFITVFVLGYMVHGTMIFNSYMAFDDVTMDYPGATITSGRWFLKVLYRLGQTVFGSYINTKGFVGIASLFLIALMAVLIAKALDLKGTLELVLLSGIFVVFPYVTSLFGYTFTAVPYYISDLMAVCSAYLISRPGRMQFNWRLFFRVLIAVVLLALSIAIYQTSVSLFIMFLVVVEIRNVLAEHVEFRTFFKRGLVYVLTLGVGLVVYSLSNKAALAISGEQLTGYQGIDNAFNFTVQSLLRRVVWAYKQFFYPSRYESYSYYHFRFVRWCYGLVLVTLVVGGGICLYKAWKKKDWGRISELVVLYVLCPLAVNSYFLLVDVDTAYIYSLMTFSQVGTYLLLLLVIDGFRQNKVWLSKCGMVLMTFIIIFFGYRANVSYTKMSIVHTQSQAYFNRLVLRIQETPFYSQDKRIAFIESEHKAENPQIPNWFWSTYLDLPYSFDSFNNTYNWKDFMTMWCDFNYEGVTEEEEKALSQIPEVKEMPCYPDAGSIELVDDTIVVKFADDSQED